MRRLRSEFTKTIRLRKSTPERQLALLFVMIVSILSILFVQNRDRFLKAYESRSQIAKSESAKKGHKVGNAVRRAEQRRLPSSNRNN